MLPATAQPLGAEGLVAVGLAVGALARSRGDVPAPLAGRTEGVAGGREGASGLERRGRGSRFFPRVRGRTRRPRSGL